MFHAVCDVILILSIDVMNVENILVDIVPRARFFLFLFDAEFTFVRGLFPLVSGTFYDFAECRCLVAECQHRSMGWKTFFN